MHHSPFAPLPGTERPVRGLFVDRWGTLFSCAAPAGEARFDPSWLCAEYADALFRALQNDWRVYLIGNEDAVAQGRMSDDSWVRLEAEMLTYLSSQGIRVERNYACLDHPEGDPPHQKPSVFLLPDTGLLYHAAQVDGIELRNSWLVGDSTLELAAGGRAGLRTIGVRTGQACEDGRMRVEPDVVAANLAEALHFLTAAAAA